MAYFSATGTGGGGKILNFATGIIAGNFNPSDLPSDYEVYLGFRPTKLYLVTITGSNGYDTYYAYDGDGTVSCNVWLTGYNPGTNSYTLPNSTADYNLANITNTGFTLNKFFRGENLRYFAIEENLDETGENSDINYTSGKFVIGTPKSIKTSNAIVFIANTNDGFNINRPCGGGVNNGVYTIIDGVLTTQYSTGSNLPSLTYSNGALTMTSSTSGTNFTYCILYEVGNKGKLSNATYSYGQVAGNAEKSFNIMNGYLICSNRANVGTSGNTTDLGIGEAYCIKNGHIYPLWRYSNDSRSFTIKSYTNGVLTIKNASSSSAQSYIIYGK